MTTKKSKRRTGRARPKADPSKARIGSDGIERKPITIRIPIWMKRAAFQFGKANDKTFTDLVCAGLGAGSVTRDSMRELHAVMKAAAPAVASDVEVKK